jgi:hypothetical protein
VIDSTAAAQRRHHVDEQQHTAMPAMTPTEPHVLIEPAPVKN